MSKKNLTTGNMALNKYRRPTIDDMLNQPLEENYYASLLFDLFEATYLPEYETVKTWKRHWGKEFKVNIKRHEATVRINKKIESIRNESPSFDDMFEFATFIKILEKVFMYKNDKDADFVCDSNLDDTKNRVLVVQCKDCLIKISLKKQSDGYPNTIDILIDRMYGKNMKTTYHIENRESNAKDITDDMLLNNVTMLIREHMAELLTIYGNIVLNEQINQVIKGKSNIEYYNWDTVHREDAYIRLDMYCCESSWYEDLKWYLSNVYKQADD